MRFEVPYSKDLIDSIKFMNTLTFNSKYHALLIFVNTEDNEVTFQVDDESNNEIMGKTGFKYTIYVSDMKEDIEKKKVAVICNDFYQIIKDIKSDFIFETNFVHATITTVGDYPHTYSLNYSFNAAEKRELLNTDIDLDKFTLGGGIYEGQKSPMLFIKLAVNTDSYLEWFSINGYQCAKFIDTSKTVEKIQLPKDGIFIPGLICKSLESWIKPKNDISIVYNKDYVIINQHTKSSITNSLILSVSRKWAEDYPNIDKLLETELDSKVNIWSFRRTILDTLKILKRRRVESIILSTKIVKDEIEAKTYPVLNIRTDDGSTNMDFPIINTIYYYEGKDIQDTIVKVTNILDNVESLGREVIMFNWLEPLKPIFLREYNDDNSLNKYNYLS